MTGEEAFYKYIHKVLRNKRRARFYVGVREWENLPVYVKVDWEAYAEGCTGPPLTAYPHMVPKVD